MITDEKPSECGVSFKESFTELIEFVRQEQRGSDTPVTVIAHGGTRCDFPIILAVCMKSDIDYDFLREYEFIDSVEVFKSNGCPTPGFDTLCTTNNIKNTKIYSQTLRHLHSGKY